MSNTYQAKEQAEASLKRFTESLVLDAMEFERERIIKLLEENDWNIAQCCFQPNCCLDTERLIALIKGEK